jgi:septal ring factor EnvC (AmiA/AmiB activator)
MMDFLKNHWFKIAVAFAILLFILMLSRPNDNIKRAELIQLELQIRKEAFDVIQIVIDSLNTSIGKTEEKIVSLQKGLNATKGNLQYIQTEIIYQLAQYKALKNEFEKINYSDSSVAAILQRIRAEN